VDRVGLEMKTLLITDRFSDSARISQMKIRQKLHLDASAKLEVVELFPWIRIKLSFDENERDAQTIINELRTVQMVAAEYNKKKI
jgi:hypothetical protein